MKTVEEDIMKLSKETKVIIALSLVFVITGILSVAGVMITLGGLG